MTFFIVMSAIITALHAALIWRSCAWHRRMLAVNWVMGIAVGIASIVAMLSHEPIGLLGTFLIVYSLAFTIIFRGPDVTNCPCKHP